MAETHEGRERVKRIAAAIAADLFVNGSGQQAQRLVLTADRPEYRDLGGWSQPAMETRIADVLARKLAEGGPR